MRWIRYRRMWVGAAALGAALLSAATVHGLAPTLALGIDSVPIERPQWRDREGHALNITYRNAWNVHDVRPMHAIPEFLRLAVVQAEDRRFFEHGGVDWTARAAALAQNLKSGRAVRGASTLTEQVVGLLRARPRSLWSRWLEGFDALRLERRYGKSDILEFYLNQVPYGGQRRGVVQAARYYFGRDLGTLTRKELLALAVLPRAPDRLDPRRDVRALERAVARLAARLEKEGLLTAAEQTRISRQVLRPGSSRPLQVEARHFLRADPPASEDHLAVRETSLAGSLQMQVARLLRERLQTLVFAGVHDAAALVVDHRRNEILSWTSEHAGRDMSGAEIDAVRVPRQPGSTLKPFIYALALERGWTTATRIEDAPLAQVVGAGVHDFHNFSRHHYGWLSLREALGNSLNIPAVKALRFVGGAEALARLRSLGLRSLSESAAYYGDGLALGNGEVSLKELVEAYASLARGGVHRTLRLTSEPAGVQEATAQVFARPVAALIADVLADPQARALEFERGLFDFPQRTAVKTGTSSDFCDAWALGFDGRHTVGIWMGNLDRSPMQGLSGAMGPALALRAIFAELGRTADAGAFLADPELQTVRVCRETGLADDGRCASRAEWFIPGTGPDSATANSADHVVEIEHPHEGLRVAWDPRLPERLQSLRFSLSRAACTARVEWWVDDRLRGTGESCTGSHAWPIERGVHALRARIWTTKETQPVDTATVRFEVR